MATSKLLVVALATGLITVGIAAQTGTVHVARISRGGHAVTRQTDVVAQPPQPQVIRPAPAAPPPPPPAAAPVQSSGDQGDGGD